MKFSIKKKHAHKRMTFAEQIKHDFDYDVDGIEDYTDEQSPDIMENLINDSNLKSRINVMKNVKGSEKIKLISSTPSLQAASTCGWTPDGGVILTDVTISTVRVKIQEEYCNEDLNDTWAQIENAAGANAQDETPPSFADIMIRYYMQRANELDENLMMNGDTTSLDDNLSYYDGFKKLWLADTDLNIYYSTETDIDATNGFDILKGLDNTVPTLVKRHRGTVGFEIICGYETAQYCIDQIFTDKDYLGKLDFTDVDGELSFILPTTTTRVRSIPSLDGTDYVFGVCYKYMFYATDLENDKDGFQFKYNDTDEMLRFGVKWRSGIQYVFPEYFTRLRLTPTS